MKFKFPFEKLLKHFDRKERIAQRDYMESLTTLDQENRHLSGILDSAKSTHEFAEEVRSNEVSISLENLNLCDEFLKGLLVQKERQGEIIKTHQHIASQKQEILLATTKEKKIMEKLKEHRKAAFIKSQRKHEMKINYELVVTRHKVEG